jgi:hypothetical protein
LERQYTFRRQNVGLAFLQDNMKALGPIMMDRYGLHALIQYIHANNYENTIVGQYFLSQRD